MHDQVYVQGFIQKCAELGVDPEALVKRSSAASTGVGFGAKLLSRLKRFSQGYATGVLRPGVGMANLSLPGADRLTRAAGVTGNTLDELGRSGIGGFLAGQATLPGATIAGTTYALTRGGKDKPAAKAAAASLRKQAARGAGAAKLLRNAGDDLFFKVKELRPESIIKGYEGWKSQPSLGGMSHWFDAAKRETRVPAIHGSDLLKKLREELSTGVPERGGDYFGNTQKDVADLVRRIRNARKY